MPGLWFLFGTVYIVIAAGIFFDHTFRLEAEWSWNEALHHEAFLVTVIWVASAYLFVSLVEYLWEKSRAGNSCYPILNTIVIAKPFRQSRKAKQSCTLVILEGVLMKSGRPKNLRVGQPFPHSDCRAVPIESGLLAMTD